MSVRLMYGITLVKMALCGQKKREDREISYYLSTSANNHKNGEKITPGLGAWV